MQRLTTVEETLLRALKSVQEALTAGQKLSVHEYMDLMNEIRRAVQMGENKMYGCAWGKHAGRCSCTEEKAGTFKNAG